MSQYAAFRFGRDAPARIATSVVMFDEAAELLPEEPMYQPIVPFIPAITSGSDTSGASLSVETWSNYPARLDLTWYQGDDVMIPLYFDNPADLDMSDQDGFEWNAEVRVIHTYQSSLLYTFSVDSEAIPASGDTPGQTKVTLYLPREVNDYIGQFRWDLHSVSPIDIDMSEFPRPPEVDPDSTWPPTTTLRSWLYGNATILPRVTATDVLPELPEGGGGGTNIPVGTVETFFVGPNGRVP